MTPRTSDLERDQSRRSPSYNTSMRFRLRTLLLLMTAACLFCGWYAYLRSMAAYHRAKEAEEQTTEHPLISKYPSQPLAVWDSQDGPTSQHLKRAHDFDHALLRPWLAFVHCKPGSIFGAPIQQWPPLPIVKRLTIRDDDLEQGDY